MLKNCFGPTVGTILQDIERSEQSLEQNTFLTF